MLSDLLFSLTCECYFRNVWQVGEILTFSKGAGKQGFQNPIVKDSFLIDNGGALGTVQSERGLTYIEVALAGHM